MNYLDSYLSLLDHDSIEPSIGMLNTQNHQVLKLLATHSKTQKILAFSLGQCRDRFWLWYYHSQRIAPTPTMEVLLKQCLAPLYHNAPYLCLYLDQISKSIREGSQKLYQSVVMSRYPCLLSTQSKRFLLRKFVSQLRLWRSVHLLSRTDISYKQMGDRLFRFDKDFRIWNQVNFIHEWLDYLHDQAFSSSQDADNTKFDTYLHSVECDDESEETHTLVRSLAAGTTITWLKVEYSVMEKDAYLAVDADLEMITPNGSTIYIQFLWRFSHDVMMSFITRSEKGSRVYPIELSEGIPRIQLDEDTWNKLHSSAIVYSQHFVNALKFVLHLLNHEDMEQFLPDISLYEYETERPMLEVGDEGEEEGGEEGGEGGEEEGIEYEATDNAMAAMNNMEESEVEVNAPKRQKCDDKCSKCGAWGKDVVKQNGMCAYCTRKCS
ncbi:hypothetical protein PROFUN_02841 [Planoprotostelium fungivorum]|uniref:Uncharacterized protein n=1 Tax=Planoprotostelium fungivorum TaxID=1890364 RepID=A0A2P6NRT3_9EUKA|nr:hypothetical protein PROFUN_02841 [Planoprotostelium fungivorum]